MVAYNVELKVLFSFSFLAFLCLLQFQNLIGSSFRILSSRQDKIQISNVKSEGEGEIFSCCVYIFRRYVMNFFSPYTAFMFLLFFFSADVQGYSTGRKNRHFIG